MESISMRALYPLGEGAGYAGGIVSTAVDGQVLLPEMLHKQLFQATIRR